MTLDPVRYSRLKLLARSPLHYAAATVEETNAMERGSAVHSMLLGGQEVLCWEEGRPRRGKEFDAFQAARPDALILAAKDYADAQAIAVAVKLNPLARAALDGIHEVERAWKFGSCTCAGRIDCITPNGITELKVSKTANPADFIWHAQRMGWLSQLAWYLDGLAASGTVLEHCKIVAVEPKPPYAVTVFVLDEQTIDRARRTYRTWLERLLVCEATDEWPAYAQSEVVLSLPDNDVALDFGDSEEAA